MSRPVSPQPTELELMILKVLWRRSPQAVSEVREALAAEDRPLAHTSVITTLNTMVRKKYLTRVKEGKAFVARVMNQPKVWLIGNEHGLAA